VASFGGREGRGNARLTNTTLPRRQGRGRELFLSLIAKRKIAGKEEKGQDSTRLFKGKNERVREYTRCVSRRRKGGVEEREEKSAGINNPYKFGTCRRKKGELWIGGIEQRKEEKAEGNAHQKMEVARNWSYEEGREKKRRTVYFDYQTRKRNRQKPKKEKGGGGGGGVKGEKKRDLYLKSRESHAREEGGEEGRRALRRAIEREARISSQYLNLERRKKSGQREKEPAATASIALGRTVRSFHCLEGGKRLGRRNKKDTGRRTQV